MTTSDSREGIPKQGSFGEKQRSRNTPRMKQEIKEIILNAQHPWTWNGQTYVQHPTPPASSPPVYSPQRERGPSHSAFKGTTSSRSIDSHPRKYDGSGHQSGSLRRAAHCGEGLADTACKEDPRLEMAEILKQQMTLFEQQQILGATLASITEATFASITEALASQQSMRRMEEMFREARDWHLKARNQRLPPSMAAAVVPRPMPRSEAVLEVNERPPAVLQSTLRQQPKNATAASASHGMTLRKKMPQAELVLPSIEKIEEDWGDREEPTALDLVVSDIVGESERELVDDVASSSAKANIKIERIQEEDSRKDEDNDAEHEEDAEEGNDDEYEQESAAVPVPVGMKRKADGQATGPPRLKKQTYHNIGKRISTSEIPNPFLEKAEEELRKRQRRLGATGARSRVHRR
ncbi:hypothetical protein B0T22DRAFT_187512 [Podospora appendiculata]|uniref:Uncharacterized protein n=1 Tax=Podospora appendiculata TaxID=314037 RepID=A0AAE0XCE1_9PEZI|nr:hypothetical protein B0T22DRAFT_187512 [Podospora appendiculata]